MTDKVQKIREGVEKLKSQLIRGACSSQIAMETRCKEEAYNEVISLLDSLQEEPEPQFKVGDTIRSKHWNTAVHKIISMDDKSYCLDNGGKVNLPSQQLWEFVEEPVSKELEEAAEEWDESLYRSDAFKAGANWQKEQMMKDATEVIVHIEAGNYPYIPQIELYDYDKDIPLAKEGDKVKIIIVKED